jgi:hypothetical protein
MNILRQILCEFLQIEPNLLWIAFELSGYGDDFHGFEALELNINNQILKNPKYKDSTENPFSGSSNLYNLTFFQKFDNILKKDSYQEALISALLPTGVSFKSVDCGACSGVLLANCIPAFSDCSIEIKKEFYSSLWRSTVFRLNKGFKGFLLNFVNSEQFGSTF